jgi:phage-related minor tail protein
LAKEINDKFIGVVDSLGNTFESSFIDALSGTKSALDGFKDFSRQLVEEIIKTYLRLAVINPIINSIFGGQGTGFQMRPTVSGGDVADRFIDIGKKFIGGRAGGGTVQGRKPIMVGERGPEMFVPNTGGRIVPNGALGGSLRGGSPTIVNQSLNFATGIQNTVRAEVMNMMPMIQNATLQAVVDQKRRGGTFAQGMS